MLTKSWKSAVFMAAVVLIAAVAIYLLAQNLASPGLFEALGTLHLFSAAEIVVGVLIFLAVLAIGVTLGAYLIYPLDDSHFGPGGAGRWLLVGLLQGLAMHGLALLGELLPDRSSALGLLLLIARLILAVVALVLIHWLVFRLPARLRGTGR